MLAGLLAAVQRLDAARADFEFADVALATTGRATWDSRLIDAYLEARARWIEALEVAECYASYV